MKGNLGLIVAVVVSALILGLYFGLGKPKLDEKLDAERATQKQYQQQLALIEQHKAEVPKLEALLPRWKEQFEVFRLAIPTAMDDDIFLRNLSEQLRANNVKLMSLQLTPAGQWFSNLNENEIANYKKENVKAEELRRVRVANFMVSLKGNFSDVLRAFENIKLYGRIYAIDNIIGPSGGGSGAIFQNESTETTPMQVSGRIFYGLSEDYLSDETLDEYFGRAEAFGAASDAYEAATGRAAQRVQQPTGEPQPVQGAASGKSPASGSAATSSDEANEAAPAASARNSSGKLLGRGNEKHTANRNQAVGG